MSAPSQVKDAGCPLPRTVWPAKLRETAIEIFSTMVGVPLTLPEAGDVPVSAQVTGMVGIAGPLCATLTLRCSLAAATLIASEMLGISTEDAAARKCDAVGEICNMVAGYFKAQIGLGDVCMLSVPTVLAGTDYNVSMRADDVVMEMPLLHQCEPIWIALHIRP